MRTRRSASSSDPVSEKGHRSVLLHEAVELLRVQPRDTVLDCTLGAGGHAREIAQKLGPGGLFIGFDLDSDAVKCAEEALSALDVKKLFINANFRNVRSELAQHGITKVDKALFDLGWNSKQLESGRGFSFRADEPLLMTYEKNPDQHALTASKIVNEWQTDSLVDILRGWGEERYAKRIARAIALRRQVQPIRTARELADLVFAAVPASYRNARSHPATKTFQALRIAVNDEMGALAEGLRSALEVLSPGGRIAAVTFHSVEDRAVKRAFAEWEKNGAGVRVTKKPIPPSSAEIIRNPRARSAKLRVFEKTNHHHDKTHTKNQQI